MTKQFVNPYTNQPMTSDEDWLDFMTQAGELSDNPEANYLRLMHSRERYRDLAAWIHQEAETGPYGEEWIEFVGKAANRKVALRKAWGEWNDRRQAIDARRRSEGKQIIEPYPLDRKRNGKFPEELPSADSDQAPRYNRIWKERAERYGLKPIFDALPELEAISFGCTRDSKLPGNHSAHVHTGSNEICFISPDATPEWLIEKDGRLSSMVLHEYAHILAPAWHAHNQEEAHEEDWVNAFRELLEKHGHPEVAAKAIDRFTAEYAEDAAAKKYRKALHNPTYSAVHIAPDPSVLGEIGSLDDEERQLMTAIAEHVATRGVLRKEINRIGSGKPWHDDETSILDDLPNPMQWYRQAHPDQPAKKKLDLYDRHLGRMKPEVNEAYQVITKTRKKHNLAMKTKYRKSVSDIISEYAKLKGYEGTKAEIRKRVAKDYSKLSNAVMTEGAIANSLRRIGKASGIDIDDADDLAKSVLLANRGELQRDKRLQAGLGYDWRSFLESPDTRFTQQTLDNFRRATELYHLRLTPDQIEKVGKNTAVNHRRMMEDSRSEINEISLSEIDPNIIFDPERSDAYTKSLEYLKRPTRKIPDDLANKSEEEKLAIVDSLFPSQEEYRQRAADIFAEKRKSMDLKHVQRPQTTINRFADNARKSDVLNFLVGGYDRQLVGYEMRSIAEAELFEDIKDLSSRYARQVKRLQERTHDQDLFKQRAPLDLQAMMAYYESPDPIPDLVKATHQYRLETEKHELEKAVLLGRADPKELDNLMRAQLFIRERRLLDVIDEYEVPEAEVPDNAKVLRIPNRLLPVPEKLEDYEEWKRETRSRFANYIKYRASTGFGHYYDFVEFDGRFLPYMDRQTRPDGTGRTLKDNAIVYALHSALQPHEEAQTSLPILKDVGQRNLLPDTPTATALELPTRADTPISPIKRARKITVPEHSMPYDRKIRNQVEYLLEVLPELGVDAVDIDKSNLSDSTYLTLSSWRGDDEDFETSIRISDHDQRPSYYRPQDIEIGDFGTADSKTLDDARVLEALARRYGISDVSEFVERHKGKMRKLPDEIDNSLIHRYLVQAKENPPEPTLEEIKYEIDVAEYELPRIEDADEYKRFVEDTESNIDAIKSGIAEDAEELQEVRDAIKEELDSGNVLSQESERLLEDYGYGYSPNEKFAEEIQSFPPTPIEIPDWKPKPFVPKTIRLHHGTPRRFSGAPTTKMSNHTGDRFGLGLLSLSPSEDLAHDFAVSTRDSRVYSVDVPQSEVLDLIEESRPYIENHRYRDFGAIMKQRIKEADGKYTVVAVADASGRDFHKTDYGAEYRLIKDIPEEQWTHQRSKAAVEKFREVEELERRFDAGEELTDEERSTLREKLKSELSLSDYISETMEEGGASESDIDFYEERSDKWADMIERIDASLSPGIKESVDMPTNSKNPALTASQIQFTPDEIAGFVELNRKDPIAAHKHSLELIQRKLEDVGLDLSKKDRAEMARDIGYDPIWTSAARKWDKDLKAFEREVAKRVATDEEIAKIHDLSERYRSALEQGNRRSAAGIRRPLLEAVDQLVRDSFKQNDSEIVSRDVPLAHMKTRIEVIPGKLSFEISSGDLADINENRYQWTDRVPYTKRELRERQEKTINAVGRQTREYLEKPKLSEPTYHEVLKAALARAQGDNPKAEDAISEQSHKDKPATDNQTPTDETNDVPKTYRQKLEAELERTKRQRAADNRGLQVDAAYLGHIIGLEHELEQTFDDDVDFEERMERQIKDLSENLDRVKAANLAFNRFKRKHGTQSVNRDNLTAEQVAEFGYNEDEVAQVLGSENNIYARPLQWSAKDLKAAEKRLADWREERGIKPERKDKESISTPSEDEQPAPLVMRPSNFLRQEPPPEDEQPAPTANDIEDGRSAIKTAFEAIDKYLPEDNRFRFGRVRDPETWKIPANARAIEEKIYMHPQGQLDAHAEAINEQLRIARRARKAVKDALSRPTQPEPSNQTDVPSSPSGDVPIVQIDSSDFNDVDPTPDLEFNDVLVSMNEVLDAWETLQASNAKHIRFEGDVRDRAWTEEALKNRFESARPQGDFDSLEEHLERRRKDLQTIDEESGARFVKRLQERLDSIEQKRKWMRFDKDTVTDLVGTSKWIREAKTLPIEAWTLPSYKNNRWIHSRLGARWGDLRKGTQDEVERLVVRLREQATEIDAVKQDLLDEIFLEAEPVLDGTHKSEFNAKAKAEGRPYVDDDGALVVPTGDGNQIRLSKSELSALRSNERYESRKEGRTAKQRKQVNAIFKSLDNIVDRLGNLTATKPSAPPDLEIDVSYLTKQQQRDVQKQIEIQERQKAREDDKPVELSDEGVTEGAISGAKRKRYGVGSTTFDTRYYIIDASQVIQSHMPRSGDPNPQYAHSESLQPRNREDTVAWVYGTALDLQPLPLLDSRGLGGGPPIIDSRGMVLDGNGRVMAFKLAETIPGRMEAYREALREEAELMGFSEEDIERAMQLENPMLVSRVLNKADIPEIVRQGNQPRTATLTTQEQSQQDAAMFTPEIIEQLASLNEVSSEDKGDKTFDDILKRSDNQETLQELVGLMTSGNTSGFFDSTGSISDAGRTRIKKAALTYALGNSPSADRVLKPWFNQDTSSDIGQIKRGVERGLLDLVKLRNAISKGELEPEYDIADDLMRVLETYPESRKFRDRKAKFPYEIDQFFISRGFGPLTVSALTDRQRALFRKLHAINRSPVTIAQLLGKYVQHASGNAVSQDAIPMWDMNQFTEVNSPEDALVAAERDLTKTGRTKESFLKDALEDKRLTGLSSGDFVNKESALGQLAGGSHEVPPYEGDKIDPDFATPPQAPPPTPVPAPPPKVVVEEPEPELKPPPPKVVVEKPEPELKPPPPKVVVEEPEPELKPPPLKRTDDSQTVDVDDSTRYFIDVMSDAAKKTAELGLAVPSERYIEKLAKSAVAYNRRTDFDKHLEAKPWLSLSTAPELSEVVYRPRYAEEHDELPDIEEYRGWARRRANLANLRGMTMADPDALDRLAALAEEIRRRHNRPYRESREAWMQDVPMTPQSLAQLEEAIRQSDKTWALEAKAVSKPKPSAPVAKPQEQFESLQPKPPRDSEPFRNSKPFRQLIDLYRQEDELMRRIARHQDSMDHRFKAGNQIGDDSVRRAEDRHNELIDQSLSVQQRIADVRLSLEEEGDIDVLIGNLEGLNEYDENRFNDYNLDEWEEKLIVRNMKRREQEIEWLRGLPEARETRKKELRDALVEVDDAIDTLKGSGPQAGLFAMELDVEVDDQSDDERSVAELEAEYDRKVREYAALKAETQIRGKHEAEAVEKAERQLEARLKEMNKMPVPRLDKPKRRGGGGGRRGGGGDMLTGFLPKGVTMEQAGYGKRRGTR